MPLIEKQPTLYERQMIYRIYDAMMQRTELEELLDYVRMYDKCSALMRSRVERSLRFIFEEEG